MKVLKQPFMTFSQALVMLKNGRKIRRDSWPDYEFITLTDNKFIDHVKEYEIEWLIVNTDILANDYQEYREVEYDNKISGD